MIVKPVTFFGGQQGGAVDYVIQADVFDFVLATNLPSPLSAREYVVWIANCVVGASSPATRAFSTGTLPGGASVRIIGIGAGRIEGAGGPGGKGGVELVFLPPPANDDLFYYGSGGGGGQGAVPGAGGLGGTLSSGGSVGQPGSPGTRNAPGAGGPAPFLGSPGFGGAVAAQNGGAGGVGLFATCDVAIVDLELWGGGGGGAGGGGVDVPGAAGGAAGVAGGSNSEASGGAAGAAADMNGNTLTVEGSSDVQGAEI